jgi:hypothetical protein
VQALKGVNTGNAGVGCILIDDRGDVVAWLELAKRQAFGQANCSQDLINASLPKHGELPRLLCPQPRCYCQK